LLYNYMKLGDEFGPEGVAEYNTVAAPLRDAGFKVYSTAYNVLPHKEAAIQIDPFMDMWQTGWPQEDLHDFFKKNNIPFDADNEVWGVGTSSWWGSFIDYGLGYGMMAARARMDGVHVHGYMRWWNNEVEGAYRGPDGPFPAVTNVVW